MNIPEYKTAKELAKLLPIPRQTFANMRHYGKGPPYIKIGSRILYDLAVVLEWMANQKVNPSGKTMTINLTSDPEPENVSDLEDPDMDKILADFKTRT